MPLCCLQSYLPGQDSVRAHCLVPNSQQPLLSVVVVPICIRCQWLVPALDSVLARIYRQCLPKVWRATRSDA